MDFKAEQVEICEKKIDFNISSEEMNTYYQKALDDYVKNVAIKGFRKGKAPKAMVEKFYGDKVQGEATYLAIDESYREYLQKENVIPLSQPNVADVNYKKGEDFSFSITLETHPQFKLNSYTGEKIEIKKTIVTSEEIEHEIDHLRKDFSSEKAVDKELAMGMVADIKIKPAKVDVEWEKKTVTLGEKPSEKEIDEQLVGLKKGEVKVLTLDKTKKVEVEVVDVKEIVLPELTDEFVNTVDKKYKNVDDLKSEIENGIKDHKLNQNKNQAFNKLFHKIVEKHPELKVPDTVLDSYLSDMVESAKQQFSGSGINDDVLKNIYRPSAEASLKWEYVRQEIVKKEGIEVSDTDIKDKLQKLADKAKMDLEKVEKYYRPEEKKRMLTSQLLEDKVRDLLTQKNEFIEVDELEEEKAQREAAEKESTDNKEKTNKVKSTKKSSSTKKTATKKKTTTKKRTKSSTEKKEDK